jgi:hypothetical protein
MTNPEPIQPEPLDRADDSLASGHGQAADVIDLIMADHRRIRRLREALDDALPGANGSGPLWVPGHVWHRLTGLLIAHFRAEEEICYLPMFGSELGATGRRHEAVADHDDIREAIGEASLQPLGSVLWWRAVRGALAVGVDHLDREERGVLADCPHRLTPSQRVALGQQWSAFTAACVRDIQRMADGVVVSRAKKS